jgi:hypothetical protein
MKTSLDNAACLSSRIEMLPEYQAIDAQAKESKQSFFEKKGPKNFYYEEVRRMAICCNAGARSAMVSTTKSAPASCN